MTVRILADSWDKFLEAEDYILSGLNPDCRIACDTETCGKEGAPREIKPALRHDNVLLGTSLSLDSQSGVYIPYYLSPKNHTLWSIDQMKHLRKFFKKLFLSEYKFIEHNSLFDNRVLGRHLWRPANVVFDSMWAAHELDENRSIGLKELGAEYLGLDAAEEKKAMLKWAEEHPEVFPPPYSQDEVMGNLWKLPLPLYGDYAIKDTMLTRAIYEFLVKDLMERQMVERYRWKHSLLPVYEEINTQGWRIDKQLLEASGKQMSKEISSYFQRMYNLLDKELITVETNLMNANLPIKNSYVWLKALIEAENLVPDFTVPMVGRKKKDGTYMPAPKDAGKFCTSKKYKDLFSKDPGNHSTATYDFIQWDGADVNSMSPATVNLLVNIQKKRTIAQNIKDAEKKGKTPCPMVVNFSSGKQLGVLLFDTIGLPVAKRSPKSNLPDVSSDVLKGLQKLLLQRLNVDPKWIKSGYDEEEEAAENGQSFDILDFRQKLLEQQFPEFNLHLDSPVNDGDDEEKFLYARTLLFLDVLLALRDREKTYGTYVVGIIKRLYSAADLRRKPEFNPATGNELHYVISNINPCGTKTGRPSSQDPNLLNIPNDKRIKASFVAPKGYKIVSADYDAQEVRVATNIALDGDMKDVFTIKCQDCNTPQEEDTRITLVLDVFKQYAPKKGDKDPSVCCKNCGAFNWSEPDPHSLNVTRIYPDEPIKMEDGSEKLIKNMTLTEIKNNAKPLRNNAKVVQFQTLYGGTAVALADALYGSTDNEFVEKAKAIQDAFFAGAPKIRQAIDSTIASATRIGYVETMLGYRRHLPDLQIEKPKFEKNPALTPDVQKDKCFGRCDLHPEENDKGNKIYIDNKACPRGDDGKGCSFYEACGRRYDHINAGKKKARAERQAFNVLIQGNSADITNSALLNVRNRRAELAKINPAWNKVMIVSQIYDACYFMIPDELIPNDPVKDPIENNYVKFIRECMEFTSDDYFVPITCEIEPPAASWDLIH